MSFYPYRKNRINILKKALQKSYHSKISSKGTTCDQSLHELNNLKLKIKKMRHSKCENALNEVALDSTRKTFEDNLVIKNEDLIIRNSPETVDVEQVEMAPETDVEQSSHNAVLHGNSFKKCKKLFFSLAQKNKSK